jgi:hypothetical protein
MDEGGYAYVCMYEEREGMDRTVSILQIIEHQSQ